MSSQTLSPVLQPFRATLRVPGSKSITNRALILAALAEGPSTLEGVLLADDTRRMLEALVSLGYEVALEEPARTVRIVGRGRDIPAPRHAAAAGSAGERAAISCGNSGTTIRFLTAMLATASGQPTAEMATEKAAGYLLDGVARMRQRPIRQLVEQLQALGADIRYPGQDGFPPVEIRPAHSAAGTGLRGGTCTFADAASSIGFAVLLAVFICIPSLTARMP